jgi:hypothetical protein
LEPKVSHGCKFHDIKLLQGLYWVACLRLLISQASKGKFIIGGVKVMLLTSSSSIFNYNNCSMYKDNSEELGFACKDYKTH